jgi:acyl-CoA synthetase (AMP-forming)/AMP-acid ligase II
MFYFCAMVLNVADLVEHAVDAAPERTALICGSERRTFAELEARTNQFAHYLIDSGVRPGDHVAVYSSNSMALAESLIAIVKARAVAVNVNFRYTENELQYVLENSDAVALIHQRSLSDKVRAVLPTLTVLRTVVAIDDGSPVDPADTFVDYEKAVALGSPERDFAPRSPDDIFLIYTGGTTGRPKGVMWRHEDIWRTLGGGVDFVTGEPLPDEFEQSRTGVNSPITRMCVAPLIHGAAQWAMFGALFTASTVVIMPKFDPHEVWRTIEEEKVNVITIVGDAMARPMIETYQSGSYDASSLFAISSSAALLSPSVKEQYLDTFPNVFLTDAIGSSETGFSGIGVVTKDGTSSAGPRVSAQRDAIIVDDDGNRIPPGTGQVGRLARGGNVALGYYKDPEKTKALFVEVDGKRYTVPGDLATHEADGTLILLGRGNMCINTGGEKVFPEEVEGVLKSHPGVFDALVFGAADDRYGTRVAAIVAWREGHEPASAELDAFGRKHLAGYKMPRSYWFVDEVGRLATGKPDYTWAKEYAAAHEASAQIGTSSGGSSASAPASA